MAKLKNIPAGNYTKLGVKYIALIDGGGCTCDNCGRLISNMVTVRNEDENKQYTIGQDCAKNLFSEDENNQINKEIKNYISDQKRIAKAAEHAKWNAAYKFLQSLCPEIDNSNVNEPWAKSLYNEKLVIAQSVHGIHISYPR